MPYILGKHPEPMIEPELLSLGLIIILSGLAQWIGWRFSFPSILLLLLFGFLGGPVFGVVHPDALFGEALFPFISLSVAILLFEGGLSLRFSQLKGTGSVVRNLLSVGMAATWLLGSAGAHFVLGLDWRLSLLLGAVLTVSGPTVVGPLLRHIRPSPTIGSILRWEGILVDSVGALLAIIVFGVVTSVTGHGLLFVAATIVKDLVVGVLLGLAGAAAMVVMLKRYWIPDYLHVAASFMAVIGVFIASNALQPESGLLAVTVMGIALINQRYVSVEHIVEFKENLRVLLIGALFIVLSARLDVSDLAYADWRLGVFLVLLILVVRPAAVALSARSSSLTLGEKTFLAAVYPRGIVAAAVSSVFALRLMDSGYPGAEAFAPLAFLTVAGTVAVYGLSALPVARYLGVAKPDPQGVLFIGGDDWVRSIAVALIREGISVHMLDEHWSNITKGRLQGIPMQYVNSVHDYVSDEVELGDMGRLVAMTPSDELNSLVASHYVDAFGRKEVYQLPFDAPKDQWRDPSGPQIGVRILFGREVRFTHLAELFAQGAEVRVTNITEEHPFEMAMARYGEHAIPVCVIDKAGRPRLATADQRLWPSPGERLMTIVPPE